MNIIVNYIHGNSKAYWIFDRELTVHSTEDFIELLSYFEKAHGTSYDIDTVQKLRLKKDWSYRAGEHCHTFFVKKEVLSPLAFWYKIPDYMV